MGKKIHFSLWPLKWVLPRLSFNVCKASEHGFSSLWFAFDWWDSTVHLFTWWIDVLFLFAPFRAPCSGSLCIYFVGHRSSSYIHFKRVLEATNTVFSSSGMRVNTLILFVVFLNLQHSNSELRCIFYSLNYTDVEVCDGSICISASNHGDQKHQIPCSWSYR